MSRFIALRQSALLSQRQSTIADYHIADYRSAAKRSAAQPQWKCPVTRYRVGNPANDRFQTQAYMRFVFFSGFEKKHKLHIGRRMKKVDSVMKELMGAMSPPPRIFGLEPPLVVCCQSHLRRQQKIMDKNSTPSSWPTLLIGLLLLTQRLQTIMPMLSLSVS